MFVYCFELNHIVQMIANQHITIVQIHSKLVIITGHISTSIVLDIIIAYIMRSKLVQQ